METVIQFLQLAFVGVVSGLFSAILAQRGHQQKRWWDLRVSAYQDLIYALSDLCYYYREHHTAHLEQREITVEFRSKLSSAWNDGYPKVRRAADAGAFLFSSEVARALKAFRDADGTSYDSYFEDIDQNFSAAEKCLAAVVEASKKDLQLNWWVQ